MPFTIADRANIRRLFDLDRDQLMDQSWLAQKMTDVETFDTDYGTNLVADVQQAIAAILELDDAIATAQQDPNYSAALVRIDGEGAIDRAAGGRTQSPIQGLLERRSELLLQIANDLKITLVKQGRLLRG